MTTDTKVILEPNITVWCYEIEKLVQQGYEYSREVAPSLLGWQYHAVMVKSDKRVAQILAHLQAGAPKINNAAEVGEIARAAKVAKKAAENAVVH